ncbi:outer membrane beta-barrel protein [Pyxidicoccus fallax]|uniref:Porin family protein n=1 Tax=Pyxidicoccus fallax TaxID=394095 RepID=A0A848LEQ5_9BACT|nr:outer membrane beta-barrel protein [Pyxidicoccus fallax]NMO14741.1 porin family protein [Pyxidicoccus fallax]NPC80440.1 outer membrane beta-barrel protein [Pyxidicoccus fallax]
MRHSMVGGVAAVAMSLAAPVYAIEAQDVSRKLDINPNPPVGLDVSLGVGGFTGDLAENTNVGPLLGIDATAQLWPLIGIEAGYEGQRLAIDDDRVESGEGIWRHNVGMLGKVGPLLDQKWRPFVGAGAGLSYLNPSSDAESVYDNDLQVEFPLAAGVDYRFGNIVAGARATYSVLGSEDLVRDVDGTEEKGSLFNAGITVGGRF